LSPQEISYFLSDFEQDGEFTTLAENPPKDFYIPFEVYKELKEANGEELEVILPG